MTITIDGVVTQTESRIIETKQSNNELNDLILKVKNSTLDESYDMGLLVKVEDGVNTDYYLTGNDEFSRSSKINELYTHNITLLGLEKILERDTLTSLNFTQPVDSVKYNLLDVVDRALKLYQLDENASRGANRKYDIQGIGTRDSSDNYVFANLSGLALTLYNYKGGKAPEFTLNTPTLREHIDDVFNLLDGRAIINDIQSGIYIIDIEYYNDDNGNILISTVDEITGKQSIEKNAQQYDIYMENAVSESDVNKQAIVFPSKGAWASVRSNETELTDTNFLMEVNDDIERVLKFEIKVDIEINYNITGGGGTQTFSGVLEADATEWLFTKRSWDSLDFNFKINGVATDTDLLWKDKYKNNSLYFDGNQIKGFTEKVDVWTLFGNVYQWQLFLPTIAYDNGDLPTTMTTLLVGVLDKPSFNTNVRDFLYRLTYVPKNKPRVILEKDKETGFGTLYFNQTDRIVDVEKLGDNAKTTLNREGNKELMFVKTKTAYSDRFLVGQRYQDYIVYKVVNDRNALYTRSSAFLSKDYGIRSERMTLANKPRQTDISPDNTFRNDIIKQYIELSFDSTGTNDSYVDASGIGRMLETFNNTLTVGYGNPVEFAYIITRDSGTNLIDTLLMSVDSKGVADVMQFYFGFPNEVSAGRAIEQLDTIYGNKYIRYATEGGLVETLEFDLCDEWLSNPDTYATQALNGQSLPKFENTRMTITNRLIQIPEMYIDKDSSEVYKMTYQIKFYTDNNDIFIGNKLATNNTLVTAESETLYVYTQLSRFEGQQIPESATQQAITNAQPAPANTVAVILTNTSNYLKVELTDNKPTNKFWAIGNANRELYLAVNNFTDSIVYLKPREER